MLLDMRADGGSGGGAPVDATYITQTPNGTLTNEQALSLLATGLLKNTTVTGVLSIAAAGIDYLAPAAIGVTVQGWDADLDTLAGLAKADGNFIVGDGAAWVVESGATARASLGLGTLAVLNSPLPIANGGSGQTSQQAAIDALTAVAGATNEHVLTKDTATGNAIFKVSAGGSSLPVADTQTIVKGSADATKLLRFEVDGFTGGATRVLTPPDADILLAGQNYANVFTLTQTVTPPANSSAHIVSGFQVTGSNNTAMLSYAAELNTTGVADLFLMTVTNTASNPNSSFFKFQIGSSPRFRVHLSGTAEHQIDSTSITNFGASVPIMRLHNVNGTANNFACLNFGDSSTAAAAISAKMIDHGSDFADLLLITRASDGVFPRLYITSAGLIGIGSNLSSPGAKLHVDQSSTTGAIPVVIFDQADLSEEFIRFVSTVGAGNPIDTAALGAYYGKVRVYVEGVGPKWLALYD